MTKLHPDARAEGEGVGSNADDAAGVGAAEPTNTSRAAYTVGINPREFTSSLPSTVFRAYRLAEMSAEPESYLERPKKIHYHHPSTTIAVERVFPWENGSWREVYRLSKQRNRFRR